MTLRACGLRPILLPLLLLQVAAPAPAPQPERTPPPPPERTPAPVMTFHGASWLEREGREEEQRPAEIFRAMGLSDGDVVADLGCGTGWFARRMARVVGPRGKVYAVDIQPEMLELLRDYVKKEGVAGVEPVLGTETDPKLPTGGLDWILMVDVYHEFQQPKAMLEAIRRSLKPTGRVALVEYRLEGASASHIKLEHRMSVEQVMAEWVPAGFRLVQKLDFLPSQHFFIFEKSRDVMMSLGYHHDVRTTLTLDEDVAAKLQAEARRSGRSFKETVNSALRRVLAEPRQASSEGPFRVEARDLGRLRPGLSLDSVGDLLEGAEGPLHR